MIDEQKTNVLLDIIDDLCDTKYSKNNIKIENNITKLKQIYSNHYRHSYSDIFNKLQGILANDFETSICLGENLRILAEALQGESATNPDDNELPDTINGFKKFSDHINLEIGRYNFIKKTFAGEDRGTKTDIGIQDYQGFGERINKAEEAINSIRPITTKAESELSKLDEKLESNKISSITALTIFSAVILAFSGGITFEAGVFKGISETTPYRLVFIVALTGFILFNTIFVLLYLVGKMTSKSISSRCKYLSLKEKEVDQCRVCGDGFCTKQYSGVSLACRIWHKYSYVFAVNSVLIFVLYECFVFWLFKPILTSFNLISSFGLFLILPFLLTGIIIAISKSLKLVQKNRIILDIKINFVSRYISSSGLHEKLINSFTISMNKILASFYGNKKEIVNELEEMIIATDCEDKKSFNRLLKNINYFVKERLLTTESLERTISFSHHKINKSKWNKLKDKLKEYIHSEYQ